MQTATGEIPPVIGPEENLIEEGGCPSASGGTGSAGNLGEGGRRNFGPLNPAKNKGDLSVGAGRSLRCACWGPHRPRRNMFLYFGRCRWRLSVSTFVESPIAGIYDSGPMRRRRLYRCKEERRTTPSAMFVLAGTRACHTAPPALN